MAWSGTRNLHLSVFARLKGCFCAQGSCEDARCAASDNAMAAGADYYKILAVTKTSSDDEIKKARTRRATRGVLEACLF